MPFPQTWADRLFAQLHVRYGDAFLAQYRDLDQKQVAADWATVLEGWERFPAVIKLAIDQLPEKPVNALAFRSLCRALLNARPDAPLALPEPAADPARVARIVAEARASVPAAPSGSPAAAVIDGIIARVRAANTMPSRGQLDFARTCQKMLSPGDQRRAELIRLGFTGIEAPIHAEIAP